MLLLIAWIGLLNSLICIGACAVVVYAFVYAEMFEAVKVAVGLSVGYFLISITAGLLLLKGLYDTQPLLIIPTLCLQFLEISVLTAGFIYGLVLFVIEDISVYLFVYCPVGLLVLGLLWYYWVKLLIHYKEQRTEKRTTISNYFKFE